MFPLITNMHLSYLVCKGVIKGNLWPPLAGITNVSTSTFSEMFKDIEVIQFTENSTPKKKTERV